MSAIGTSFSFDGYLMRPAVESDRPLAEEWNDADIYHRNTLHPEFWLEQGAGINSYAMEDVAGTILFFKMHRRTPYELQIFIQFAPRRGAHGHARTAQALATGFEWLKKELPSWGFKLVYFTSKSPALIQFCTATLGFSLSGDRLTWTVAEARKEPTHVRRDRPAGRASERAN